MVAKNEIALVFDQNIAWNPGAPTMLFLANSAGATSGTVSSGSATGNTIKLQVSGAASAATITYLKGLVSWLQPNILYGANGIAALTFADVPIAALGPYGTWANGTFANAFTDKAAANSLIADGRGWSNKDRYSAYDKLDPDTLLEKPGSWSPTVRERAAIAISRRKDDKRVAAMVNLLDSPNLFARYGACEVIILRKAVAAGLRNEDGRARSDIASAYKMLSFEEIQPLLPAILDAAAKPAPSGEMFADGIRIAGLQVLAAHHVAEGIPACTDYILNQNIWASQVRTPKILKILVSYGAHAKSAIPQLRQAAEIFDKGEGNFPKHMSVQKAADVRKAIADIEVATDTPELRRIR